MNRLEHDMEAVDRWMRREDPRPSLVEWAKSNTDTWIDCITDHDPKVLAKALESREDWRDFWTQVSEKIEALYEEATSQPEEPDTERMREAQAINAENRRVYG